MDAWPGCKIILLCRSRRAHAANSPIKQHFLTKQGACGQDLLAIAAHEIRPCIAKEGRFWPCAQIHTQSYRRKFRHLKTSVLGSGPGDPIPDPRTQKKGRPFGRPFFISLPADRDDPSLAQSAFDWRFTAAYLPRRSTSSSKSRRSPSLRAAMPARSTALMWTNASGWPSSR